MPQKSSKKSSKKQEPETPQGSLPTLTLLTKQLQVQMAYQRIWHSKDFQEYLLPQLTQDNRWLDPQEFKDNAEFQRAYEISWARARAFTELITMLETAEDRIADTTKRIEKIKARNEATTTRTGR